MLANTSEWFWGSQTCGEGDFCRFSYCFKKLCKKSAELPCKKALGRTRQFDLECANNFLNCNSKFALKDLFKLIGTLRNKLDDHTMRTSISSATNVSNCSFSKSGTLEKYNFLTPKMIKRYEKVRFWRCSWTSRSSNHQIKGCATCMKFFGMLHTLGHWDLQCYSLEACSLVF